MTLDEAFTELLGNEGGYSNNPADPGGETMWGITFRVARYNGYLGPMRDMPQGVAKAIYQRLYWTPTYCDKLPDPLRFQVFDAAVNNGVKEAILLLQQALGTQADGYFGPATLSAVQSCDPVKVAMRYLGYRLKFFTGLDTWPTFGKGWANRVGDNLLKAGS
jgi:lysozyme family protein